MDPNFQQLALLQLQAQLNKSRYGLGLPGLGDINYTGPGLDYYYPNNPALAAPMQEQLNQYGVGPSNAVSYDPNKPLPTTPMPSTQNFFDTSNYETNDLYR